MKKEYLKPKLFYVLKPISIVAQGQYILNITDEYCHGEACGETDRKEFTNGSDVITEGCFGRTGPYQGDVTDWKCLETGDQIYHMIFVSVTPGGSAKCDLEDTPSVFHITFEPGLPQLCTVTRQVEKGVNRCLERCR